MIRNLSKVPKFIEELMKDNIKEEVFNTSKVIKLLPALTIYKLIFFNVPLISLIYLPYAQVLLSLVIMMLPTVINLYCLFKYKYPESYTNVVGHLIADLSVLVFIVFSIVYLSKDQFEETTISVFELVSLSLIGLSMGSEVVLIFIELIGSVITTIKNCKKKNT
jgi:hypothetical protein